jgi:hypothetical protein
MNFRHQRHQSTSLLADRVGQESFCPSRRLICKAKSFRSWTVRDMGGNDIPGYTVAGHVWLALRPRSGMMSRAGSMGIKFLLRIGGSMQRPFSEGCFPNEQTAVLLSATGARRVAESRQQVVIRIDYSRPNRSNAPTRQQAKLRFSCVVWGAMSDLSSRRGGSFMHQQGGSSRYSTPATAFDLLLHLP